MSLGVAEEGSGNCFCTTGNLLAGQLQAGRDSSYPVGVSDSSAYGHQTSPPPIRATRRNTNTKYLDKRDREPQHKTRASVRKACVRLMGLQETWEEGT